ncbi:MAG: hypothetical protein QGG40_03415 [Myxococcota bacterium]|jgi:predicted extracellular nuclease|nr:hypothetical protein [Myxococcota bacterium]
MRHLALFPLLAIGCIQPKSTDDDSDSEEGTSIQDIRTGAVEEDSDVTLSEVIVTSEISSSLNGFFIQEPEGGEYSGVFVYLQGALTDLSVSVGDELTIQGSTTEYYEWTELSLESASGIEVTGSGSVASETLTGTEDWGAEDWEPWESVLVTLVDQTAETSVNSYGEVELSGGLKMDNAFFDFDTEQGAVYTAVTGPLSYAWEEFHLNPRTEDDLEGYTAGEGPATVSCAQIQGGEVAEDSQVTLESVVATSGLTRDDAGFFVQDDGGGSLGGIYIYLGSTELEVAAGDVLTLSGTYTEYYDLSEISVYDSSDVEITGSGTPVATELTETPDDWEDYEGVLITLSDVTLDSSPDDYNQIDLNWGIMMDDLFYSYDLEEGESFSSVTGVLTYNYSEYKIGPRDEDDLAE